MKMRNICYILFFVVLQFCSCTSAFIPVETFSSASGLILICK